MTDRPALFFAHANFDGDESRCSCTALGPGPHTREQIPAYEQGRRLRVPTGIRETGASPSKREKKKLTLQPVRRHRRWATEAHRPQQGWRGSDDG